MHPGARAGDLGNPQYHSSGMGGRHPPIALGSPLYRTRSAGEVSGYPAGTPTPCARAATVRASGAPAPWRTSVALRVECRGASQGPSGKSGGANPASWGTWGERKPHTHHHPSRCLDGGSCEHRTEGTAVAVGVGTGVLHGTSRECFLTVWRGLGVRRALCCRVRKRGVTDPGTVG